MSGPTGVCPAANKEEAPSTPPQHYSESPPKQAGSSPLWGRLADPPQRNPAANHGPTFWRLPPGLCFSLQKLPTMPSSGQGQLRPRVQGASWGSLNCTCHRVPSTQLVSCLPLCGSGDGAPQCPLSTLSFHSAGSAGPGSSFVRAHVNMYILRLGLAGAAPSPFFMR